ncbi:MAG: hypothetical protein RLZZ326_3389 [Planctomycetota bacterium]|jgi:hypothetical protein
MTPLWHVTGDDIIRLQGFSKDFVELMNSLISAHTRGVLPITAVDLNVKVTEPDGGVDAAVHAAIPNDPTGYFAVPTCWQFKAQSTDAVKAPGGRRGGQEAGLRSEASKSGVKDLVSKGYGYRFCISDALPPPKKTKWEGYLTDEASKTLAGGPPPMVVCASKLAEMINALPSLIPRLKPLLNRGRFQTLAEWSQTLRRTTRVFIETGAWPSTFAHIQQLTDFSQNSRPFLMIHGEAGVGKSRSVCEALHRDPTIDALVAVTSDETAAKEFAMTVASDGHTKAILVADECTLDTRIKLNEIAKQHASRFRVIALDNSLKRGGDPGEIRLTRLATSEVVEILRRNYGHIPADRREAIVKLSEGFVRLAVDLCEHSSMIFASGSPIGSLGFLQDEYLDNRLKPDELTAVKLVSLLTRVGFREEFEIELTQLCAHPGIAVAPATIRNAAERIKHSPGFIVFAGRFLHVTPSIIAQVAFRSAWSSWIAIDPPAFLRLLPDTLIHAFVTRAREAGTADMRMAITDFFRGWTSSLDPPSLGLEQDVARLTRIIEVEPETNLPVLRALVESASIEALEKLHCASSGGRQCRLQLVWLAEGLARFPETFRDAEAILFRLGLAESDPSLGNNATRVWASLFRIIWSGTPMPFTDRIEILAQRLQSAEEGHVPLLLKAVEESLEHRAISRLVPPPVIFGRLTPAEWNPSSQQDVDAAVREAFSVASGFFRGDGSLAKGLRSLVVRRLASHLLAGFFPEVKAVIGPPPLPDQLLTELAREIEEFLDVFCDNEDPPIHQPNGSPSLTGDGKVDAPSSRSRIASKTMENEVREWYRGLLPTNLHGRLVSVVGQDHWRQRLDGDADDWHRAIEELAAQLAGSTADLSSELEWLSSPEARSAYHFGQALARHDVRGSLAERMCLDIPLAGGVVLARGYVEQIAASRTDLLPLINTALDQLQQADPRVAYDVLFSAGAEVRKVERLFALVDQGGIEPEHLQGLEYGIRGRPIDEHDFFEAIDRLQKAVDKGSELAASAAVHLAYMWLSSRDRAAGETPVVISAQLKGVLQELLEKTLTGVGREPNFWVDLADRLVDIDIDAGLAVLGKALLTRDPNTRQLAERSLTTLAGRAPLKVIDTVGSVLLSPQGQMVFRTEGFSALRDAIPDDAVLDWVDRNGKLAARAIAEYLPLPFETDKGEIVVPHITETILDRYGNDQGVYDAFEAGASQGKWYGGDIASEYDREARVARGLKQHRLKRIREWAATQERIAIREAEHWRRYDEESNAPQ